MEDIRSLSRDVKKFSQELDKFEQYLEKDTEPPDCEETIRNFRSIVKGTLSSLTAEYSNIQSQVAAATSTSERFRKLLSSMESLVEKRELQLSKYGFKPTKQELPSYPDFKFSKKSRSEEDVVKKMDVILQKVSHFTHPDGVSASSSTTVGEALIAKYTPAKRKCTANQAPGSAPIQSALLSRYSGDHGDKTYVISPTAEGTQEGQIQHIRDANETKSAIKSGVGFEERFAKYSNKSNQDDMTTERKASSFESNQGLAKRIERYSIMPKQDNSSFVAPSQPLDEVKQVKDIGSVLSKYDAKPSKIPSVQKREVKDAESISSPSASPPPYTPPAVTQRESVNPSSVPPQEESFSVGLVPNHLRQSLAFQDDDLERTVNVPHSSRKKPALTQPMSVISTPEVLQRVEGKTPVCAMQGYTTPHVGSVSTDLFTRSQSKISELKQIPSSTVENDDKKNSSDNNSVSNENVDSNYGAATEAQSVSSVSSIVSKYSKKYNFA